MPSSRDRRSVPIGKPDVIDANKDGLSRIEARQVIDCTGDGDNAYWAGCPTISSKPLMPLTMHFRIGNVTPVQETKAPSSLLWL